jgi:glyoxylase-like metal-dependent hydrolase (beta-lactamase superfamily II)
VRGASAFLQQLTNSIALIDTQALGEPGVVAGYLVKGKENALIDMGYRSSAEVIIRDLSQFGIAEDGIDYLLPTHVHLDHSGSCGALAQRFPKAAVRVHPRGEPHLADPTRLVKGATEVFGETMMRKFGEPEPVSNKRIHGILDDEQITLGNGVTLRAIWTPGHAPHHLSYLVEDGGALFTGDAVGISYSTTLFLIPTTPPPSFKMERAMESLERLRKLSVTNLFTPHFGQQSNARQRIEENAAIMLSWKKRLETLKSNGLPADEVVRILSMEISDSSGMSLEELPEFLRTSIRVSAIGFLGYLEKSLQQ